MQLVLPTSEFKESFIAAVREFQAGALVNITEKQYADLSIPELESNFQAYVEKEISFSRGENLPDGYVPCTIFWLVDKGEYIGRVSIRHELSEHLRKIGGHIGYDIRPNKREQGYGSKILELALHKASELGIKKVLVTCDENNLGSKKIIEKNGGVLESREDNPETGVAKLRYWITSI